MQIIKDINQILVKTIYILILLKFKKNIHIKYNNSLRTMVLQIFLVFLVFVFIS